MWGSKILIAASSVMERSFVDCCRCRYPLSRGSGREKKFPMSSRGSASQPNPSFYFLLLTGFKMTLLRGSLALRWTPTLCCGRRWFSARTTRLGKEEPLSSCWNSRRITPTKPPRSASWPKCSTPTFTTMAKFVWIFFKISGVPSTTSLLFWLPFKVSCATPTPLHQLTRKPVVFTMKIDENTIAVYEKSWSKAGSTSHDCPACGSLDWSFGCGDAVLTGNGKEGGMGRSTREVEVEGLLSCTESESVS